MGPRDCRLTWQQCHSKVYKNNQGVLLKEPEEMCKIFQQLFGPECRGDLTGFLTGLLRLSRHCAGCCDRLIMDGGMTDHGLRQEKVP